MAAFESIMKYEQLRFTYVSFSNSNRLFFNSQYPILNDLKFLSLVLTVPDEGDEHEYKKDPSRELQVLFGLVLTQGWDSGEKCLALGTGLGQNQKEGSDKGKVPEQELHVPKDTVGYRLKIVKKETV